MSRQSQVVFMMTYKQVRRMEKAMQHRKISTYATQTIAKMACCAVLGLAPATTLLTPTTASAQQLDDSLYNGAKARVNRSASLRSLTEAVASASCRVGAGIQTELAASQLANYRDEFTSILNGLENGSAILGMPGAEQDARALRSIQATASGWAPMNLAALSLSGGSGSAEDAASIRSAYSDMFEQTVVLAAVISGEYLGPQQLLQSDATVLNFAVRQRALAYRMARAMCELQSGAANADTRDELATTVDLFERSLVALRDGFPSAGINPPPNDAVADSLNATFEMWRSKRSIFDAALAGQSPSADAVIAAAELSIELSKSMNNSITLYLIATPGQDGVYRVPLEAYSRNELAGWLTDPAMIAAIKDQNARHAGLSEDEVIALDQQWRAEAGAGGGP